MSELVELRWTSNPGAGGLPRRDRRPCSYEAYVPDPLVGRRIVLEGDVAADVADAEAAIIRLNTQARALVDTEALARILLRAEAVASSRIEGLEIGAQRLLRAEVIRGMRQIPSDVTAVEILNNIDALIFAVESVGVGVPITPKLLLGVHQRLLAGTRLQAHAGKFRVEQTWIGGSSYNPCSAVFVPPPPELVERLVDDLCAFCSHDNLPAVVQAAIAHAQFESIHPFVDGNGRTGRALIHLVLRTRGVATRVLPPISLILATWAQGYIDGLTKFRHVGSPTSPAAFAGVNVWVGRFATACVRAVDDATAFEERSAELERQWRDRLGRVRANSAVDVLLRTLPGAPIVTVDSAAALIGRTYKPAAAAIERLVEIGILRQVNVGRRNRAFEAHEVVSSFTALERQLASPKGDTRRSKPSRAVPRNR